MQSNKISRKRFEGKTVRGLNDNIEKEEGKKLPLFIDSLFLPRLIEWEFLITLSSSSLVTETPARSSIIFRAPRGGRNIE